MENCVYFCKIKFTVHKNSISACFPRFFKDSTQSTPYLASLQT